MSQFILTHPPAILFASPDLLYASVGTSIYRVTRNASCEIYNYESSGLVSASADTNRVYIHLHTPLGHSLQVLEGFDGAPLWHYTIPTMLPLPPLVRQQRVYIAEANSITALDAQTGTHLWHCPLNSWTTPLLALDDTSLYTITTRQTPRLMIIDQASGILRRNFPLSTKYNYLTSSPLSLGHQAIFARTSDGYAAINKHDGSIRWSISIPYPVTHSYASDGKVYLGFRTPPPADSLPALPDVTIQAFSEIDGHVQWQYQLTQRQSEAFLFARPTMHNGILYVGLPASQPDSFLLCALHTTYGQYIWQTPLAGNALSSPAIAGNTLFIGSNNGYVYALNALDGSVVWKRFVDNSYQTGTHEVVHPWSSPEA